MKLIWFIWGLPQNLIGLVMFIFYKALGKKHLRFEDSYVVYVGGNSGAVSLGMFVFIFTYNTSLNLEKHEYGHSIQSKILGPLYLLLIGLPSIIWAGLFRWYRRKYEISYYRFYTEKWADRLGEVER